MDSAQLPQFIAEVSSNHNQDLDRCLQFVDVAADIGCTGIKFQLFKLTELFSPEILAKSEQHRKRAQWELALELIPEIAKRCRERKILFGCTPFYLKAVKELYPYVDFYKISSYELLWAPLIEACAKTRKPMILSTGMATMDEVEKAVAPLLKSQVQFSLLHCVSAYPTPIDQANLAVIKSLREALGCPIGWSDHSVSPAVVTRAVHYWGASVIEFHLDIDAQGEEYAGGHCWLPEQIGPLIRSINEGFLADGSQIKKPSKDEIADRQWRSDPEDGLRPLKSTRELWQTQ